MHSSLIIKKPTSKDLPDILPLLKQLWPDRKFNDNLRKTFLKGLKNKSQIYLIVELKNKIIGFCSATFSVSLWDQGNSCFLDSMIIDSPCQGRGYGKALLDRVLEIAKKRKCRSIGFDCGLHRTGAHKFYESQGLNRRGYFYVKTL